MLLYETIFSYIIKKYSCNTESTDMFLFTRYFTSNAFNTTTTSSPSDLPYTYDTYLKYKYFVLKNFILHDQTTDLYLNRILHLFGTTQRIYFALIRFKHIALMKSKKYLNTQMDLNFNDLNDIPNKYKIDIINNHTKYQFNILDLIRIINSSLSYDTNFFTDPKVIKNPWSNTPFSRSNLYNIYFFIKYSTISMPILLLRFFQSNFSLQHFEKHNQFIIKNIIIGNCNKLNDEYKHIYIRNMLYFYNANILSIKHKLHISDIFPRARTIQLFGKYIKTYLSIMYSYEEDIRIESRTKLMSDLLDFKKMNPFLGRRIKYTNINKLFYISKLVHENKDFILTPVSYIPHPSMISIEQRSFCIDHPLKLSYTYFPVFENNKPTITPNKINIDELFIFVKDYKFSDRQLNIITELYYPLVKKINIRWSSRHSIRNSRVNRLENIQHTNDDISDEHVTDTNESDEHVTDTNESEDNTTFATRTDNTMDEIIMEDELMRDIASDDNVSDDNVSDDNVSDDNVSDDNVSEYNTIHGDINHDTSSDDNAEMYVNSVGNNTTIIYNNDNYVDLYDDNIVEMEHTSPDNYTYMSDYSLDNSNDSS